MTMRLVELVATSYLRLHPYRRRVGWISILLILVCALATTTIEMEEDIAAMLPDRGSSVTRDFDLLQRAPFARRAVINLHSPEADTAALIRSADTLAATLDPELFGPVATGPDPELQMKLLPWLSDALPLLLTEPELEQLARDLRTEGSVEGRLAERYAQLLAPEGWALKTLIRKDPLDLSRMALEKLRYINLIPGMRLADGHFISENGKNVLLLAEPPVAITDAAGARLLEDEFIRATAAALPPGITATLTSGHRYTLANAKAIQGDLWRILTISSLAILALFFIYLRSARALFVFLLPVSVVCIAALVVSAVFPVVSAITIGFGAVLLGITIDFGLHVYFSLRHAGSDAAERLRGVVRPVLFGGLTTLAAFAVLLASDLPGQRQLAVFSMTGIAAALVLALWVLPQLIPSGQGAALEQRGVPPASRYRGRVLGIWLLALIVCATQVPRLEFNGDLRSMSLVPTELASAEEHLRTTWGDFRGLAMLWSQGESSQQRLESNYRLFELLQRREAGTPPVSLAPLVPPRRVQEENLARWQRFWTTTEGESIRARLQEEAQRLGFSAGAFAPFFAALESTPPPHDLAGLQAAGLGDLSRSLVGEDGALLTLVADDPDLPALIDESFAGEVIAVSPGGFRRELSAAIDQDFRRFILSALAAVTLLLVILFRRPRPVIAAAVPVLSGMLVMFGLMALFGLSFNLFNVIASILVIGLGIDYGIFMVCRLRDGLDRATDRAVLVSGLTTLAGFGALALAQHPALHSIGVTVLLGIGAALPAALLVIPALYREESACDA